jgi:creatinine amidohydrolase/Fe(II)-dependent formamide hydrolase-like protein
MYLPQTPHYLPALSFPLIEARIARKPAIILPVGGLEPLGRHVPLGAANLCVTALADQLSAETGVLMAPLFPFGATRPFRAFGGAGGMHWKRLGAAVAAVLRDYIAQGARQLLVVDGLYGNDASLAWAARYIQARYPQTTVSVLAWQREPDIRRFIGEATGTREPGRSEVGLLSMASALGMTFAPPDSQAKQAVKDPSAYRTWSRRGKDPEKFRKLYPDATVAAHQVPVEKALGEELLKRVVGLFVDRIEASAQPGHK